MKFIDYLDCKPQEFGVTHNKFLSYVHPYDREFVENFFKSALNEKTINIDYRIILANGEERVVSCTEGSYF